MSGGRAVRWSAVALVALAAASTPGLPRVGTTATPGPPPRPKAGAAAAVVRPLLAPPVAPVPDVRPLPATALAAFSSPETEGALASIIGNVPGATAAAYAVHDDRGHTMDCLKIIANPAGGYAGVYHYSESPGIYTTAVASSTDLLHWTFHAVIDGNASQPTIAALADGGFLVVEEADRDGQPGPPRNWLRFRHYPSSSALGLGASDFFFNAPHTLAPATTGAEGTPSIYTVALAPDILHSTITVGFHYLVDETTDRQARGVLRDFRGWSTAPDGTTDGALSGLGASGKHGGRDTLQLGDTGINVHEAQLVLDDTTTWRVYVDQWRLPGTMIPVTIHTGGGSVAFANPKITRLRSPAGRPAIAVTIYIPAAGAAPGEAGELVYYVETPLAA